MRKLLFLAVLLVSASCCFAQGKADAERDHVRLTLADGTVREGYIQQYWTQGGLFRKMNTSFTMSPGPGGEDAQRYSAETVSAIEFIEKTSTDGRYDRLESHLVANPSTLRPRRTARQFVYVEGESPAGRMYWWNGLDRQAMQLGRAGISTIYGVCLKGDSMVVPFMTGSVVSLNAMRIRYKKTRPGLVDYVDRRVLKGGRRLWETLAYRPMLFLEICEEWFQMQEEGDER